MIQGMGEREVILAVWILDLGLSIVFGVEVAKRHYEGNLPIFLVALGASVSGLLLLLLRASGGSLGLPYRLLFFFWGSLNALLFLIFVMGLAV